MKPVLATLLFALLLHTTPAPAQPVTVSPMNARFTDSLTLYFNLNLCTDARSRGLLGQTTGLYLWMGAGTSQNPFAHTPAAQTSFNGPVPGAELTRVGNNLWRISLNPATWCGVPAGTEVAQLALVVKNADGSAQTEDLLLQPAKTEQLKEVVVRASNKPFVEKQAGKTILNVQSDVAASGGTVFEALQRAPGVSITGDDNIIMSGKAGVQVMIDGKPTLLSDRDLANFLKATPAAQVATIEIISTPGSQYDAQGNAGIINIKLRKSIQQGLNGNLNAAYTQAQHYRANASGNLNYRYNKWNLYANAGYNKNLQHTDGYITRQVPTAAAPRYFDNRTTDIDRGEGLNYRLGADYYASKRSTLGLLYKANYYYNPMETLGTTTMQSPGKPDSGLQTQSLNTYRTRNHSLNANYKWTSNKGIEANVDADYIRFNNANGGTISTQLVQANGNPYGYTANDLQLQTTLDIWSVKTDWVIPVKKWKGKWEAGAKWVNSATNNRLNATIWQNNGMVPDSGRTNLYTYHENITAAYASWQQQSGKWQYQAGLRAEWSIIKGRSTNLAQQVQPVPDTSYINLFPSASVRYTVNDKNSLGLSAGRRINRPTYQDLNPFEMIFDNYTSERGNPYLRPSYATNAELNYNYAGAFDATLGYSRTAQFFQTISQQSGDYTTAMPYNLGTLQTAYLNLSLGLPLTKWWYSYNSVNSFYNQYRGAIAEGQIDNSAWGMGWYTSQSFSLPKEWKLQLSSWGNSATRDALFRTAWLGSVDVGAAKTFGKGKWNARLSLLDIFNTQRWKQQVGFGSMQFTYYRKWESRGLRLQINYKLGKTNFSARQRSTGSEEEASRIKTKS